MVNRTRSEQDMMAALHRLRDQVFLAIDEVGTTDTLTREAFMRVGDAYSEVFFMLQRQNSPQRSGDYTAGETE
jgi:hypothetical protein